MPINQKLTDRTEAATATDNALIHIVEPSDISQSPDGSSYKIKKSNYLAGLATQAYVDNEIDTVNDTIDNLLTDDELAAINSANAPDALNPFATMDDLPIGGETLATLGALISTAGDATPNDTDYVATSLTAGGLLKKITWTNVKAFLKTYYDTIYQAILTETVFGTFLNSLTSKNTLIDADLVSSVDTADSNKAKKTTWLNVWTNYIKVKADVLYATIAQLDAKENIISGVVASGTDTYTATYSPTIAYTDGLKVIIRFTNANTGASTININSLGAKSIVKVVSTALVSGDIVAGATLLLVYNGTNFVAVSGLTASGGTQKKYHYYKPPTGMEQLSSASVWYAQKMDTANYDTYNIYSSVISGSPLNGVGWFGWAIPFTNSKVISANFSFEYAASGSTSAFEILLVAKTYPNGTASSAPATYTVIAQTTTSSLTYGNGFYYRVPLTINSHSAFGADTYLYWAFKIGTATYIKRPQIDWELQEQ